MKCQEIFFPISFFFFFLDIDPKKGEYKCNTKYPLFSSTLFTEATRSYTLKDIMELIGITINVVIHRHLGMVQSRHHSSSRHENTEFLKMLALLQLVLPLLPTLRTLEHSPSFFLVYITEQNDNTHLPPVLHVQDDFDKLFQSVWSC